MDRYLKPAWRVLSTLPEPERNTSVSQKIFVHRPSTPVFPRTKFDVRPARKKVRSSAVGSRQGCGSQRRALAGPGSSNLFNTRLLPIDSQFTPQWRQRSVLVVRPCGLPLQLQLSMPEPLPSMACDAILHRKLKCGSSHSLNRGPN